MSLVSYGNNADPGDADPITNNAFWPAIDPAGFRAAHRVDDSVTNARIVEALAVAMADINRQLVDWQRQQTDAGHTTVDDVPLADWHTDDHYQRLYVRAVHATAHASLMERYRDHTATGEGDDRGDGNDEAADHLRRDARWAVAEILGTTHSTVELI